VYCYTSDFGENTMPLSVVNNFKKNTTTLCCKSILFTSFLSSIYEYSAASLAIVTYEPQFFFVLDSTPSKNVTIVASIIPIVCSSSSGVYVTSNNQYAAVSPSSFQFYASSTYLSASFVVRGTVGCYKLSLKSSSGSKNEMYTTATRNMTIISVTTVPNAPQVLNGSFSNSGGSIVVQFDVPTDRGATFVKGYSSSFNCSQIVDFKFASTSLCKWLSTTKLAIELFSNSFFSRLVPGDTIILLPRKVKRACSGTICVTYSFTGKTNVVLLPPLNPFATVASLTVASKMGQCDDVVLNPTSSIGFVARAWKSVVWSVFRSENIYLDRVSSFLNSEYKNTSCVVVVPKEMFIVGYSSVENPPSYTFELKLTNFFNATSIARVTTTIVTTSNEDPTVRIYGLENNVYYRWQPIQLFADAKLATCAKNSSSLVLQYVWKVFRNDDGIVDVQYLPEIASVALNPRVFLLKPFALLSSTTYTVQVIAYVVSKSTSKRVQSSDSVVIQVGQSGVVAMINGGMFQSQSVNRSISLDASASYDIDNENNNGNTLKFLWTCSTVSPLFGNKCNGFDTIDKTSSVLYAPRVMNIPSMVYSITVYVTNGYGKSDSATCQLSLINSASLPTVTTLSSSYLQFNPNDKIILTGAVSSNGGASQASWVVSSPSGISISDIALTSVSKLFLKNGTSTTFQLSIPPFSLISGLSYTFTLSASTTLATNTNNIINNNIIKYSTKCIVVFINEPPVGGLLSTNPASGVALATLFELYSHMWVDNSNNYPLQYSFSYYTLNLDAQYVLQSKSQVSYVSGYIAQGVSNLDYIVTCVVTAFDSLHAYSNATSTIHVLPNTNLINETSLISYVFNKATIKSSNPSVALQTISAVSNSLLNSVNCSVVKNCAALNRDACSVVPMTCGACKQGFTGISGFSNIGCLPVGAYVNSGSDCSKNSDCLSGYCNKQKICVDVPKTCPNNCNVIVGYGKCVFADFNNVSTDECLNGDFTCRSVCVCKSDRFGLDCSIDKSTNLALVKVRDDLCFDLVSTLSTQDVSSDVFVGRMTAISSIFSTDSNQISDAALMNCSHVLLHTVLNNPNTACLGNVYKSVFNAFSDVLGMRYRISSSLLRNISLAISTVAVSCQKNSAVNETPFRISLSNLKLVTTLAYATDLSSSVFSTPLTTYEIDDKKQSVELELAYHSSTIGFVVGVTAVQLPFNPSVATTGFVNSSIVAIELSEHLNFFVDVSNQQGSTQNRKLNSVLSMLTTTLSTDDVVTPSSSSNFSFGIKLQNQKKV